MDEKSFKSSSIEQRISRGLGTMKVLFVCYANVARSQIAQEYFNFLTGEESLSAGYGVESLGLKKVEDSTYHRSIKFLEDILGVDISQKETIQLTQKLIDSVDLTIVILSQDQYPSWLTENKKVRWWNFEDTPGLNITDTYNIWYNIMIKVEDLIKEINNIMKAKDVENWRE